MPPASPAPSSVRRRHEDVSSRPVRFGDDVEGVLGLALLVRVDEVDGEDGALVLLRVLVVPGFLLLRQEITPVLLAVEHQAADQAIGAEDFLHGLGKPDIAHLELAVNDLDLLYLELVICELVLRRGDGGVGLSSLVTGNANPSSNLVQGLE